MTLLIVASETSSPLCTDTPIPTDGQPQWWVGPGGYRAHLGPDEDDHSWCDRCVPDGPSPFTVAVWRMYQEPDHKGHEPDRINGTPWLQCLDCSTEDEVVDWTIIEPVGAIVELTEVVGPSHYADECFQWIHELGVSDGWHCHPDAAPDCFHTPVGTVTPIDPIPCERPEEGDVIVHDDGGGYDVVDRQTWWADEDLTAKLTEMAG